MGGPRDHRANGGLWGTGVRPSQWGTLRGAVDKFAQVQDFFGKICGEKRDLDSNHVF
jgi:hypothetical protein